MARVVVVQLWKGPLVVRTLSAAAPEPTVDELDAIAAEWTPANDGVRPSVRLLERTTIPGRSGAAGSIPA